MKVEVLIESHVIDQVVHVYIGRGVSQDDALLRAAHDLAEIRRILAAGSGLPEGAMLRSRGPNGSWWSYSAGLWVAVTSEERVVGRFPFSRRVKTLTVVAAGPPPVA